MYRLFFCLLLSLLILGSDEFVKPEYSGKIEKPVPFPKDLSDFFVKIDDKNKELHQRFIIPKNPGKIEVKLPKTKETVSSFYGDISTNYDGLKGDVSIDGRLNSKFGPFGFEIHQVLDRGNHNLIIYLTKAEDVKKFYKQFSGKEVPADAEDLPYIEMHLYISSDKNKVKSTEEELAKFKTTTYDQEL